MNIRKLTFAALLTAIGVVSAHVVMIPVGVAKAFPVQHGINLLAAIVLGPGYAVGTAFSISLIRNLLGTGSFLAFPGSMIGVLLAAVIYQKTKNYYLGAIGELVGTGVLGALASYPIATLLMGREVALFFFVVPFSLSSFAGVLFGLVILQGILKISVFKGMTVGGDK